jgi:hypothetical protein
MLLNISLLAVAVNEPAEGAQMAFFGFAVASAAAMVCNTTYALPTWGNPQCVLSCGACELVHFGCDRSHAQDVTFRFGPKKQCYKPHFSVTNALFRQNKIPYENESVVETFSCNRRRDCKLILSRSAPCWSTVERRSGARCWTSKAT